MLISKVYQLSSLDKLHSYSICYFSSCSGSFFNSREINAFIYDSPFIDLGASKMPGCSLMLIGKPKITKAYAMAFPEHSKWTDPVTNLLLKYERKDYFRQLKDKRFRGGCFYTDGASQSNYKMKPANFSGLLFILCGATTTRFLLLLGEYLWSRHERKEGKYAPNKIRQSITSVPDEQQNEQHRSENFGRRLQSQTIPPF